MIHNVITERTSNLPLYTILYGVKKKLNKVRFGFLILMDMYTCAPHVLRPFCFLYFMYYVFMTNFVGVLFVLVWYSIFCCISCLMNSMIVAAMM